MRKTDEKAQPESCFNQALPQELTFVLLGRDEAAPAAIRAWVEERLKRNKNLSTDRQIMEALACAERMEIERQPVRLAVSIMKDLSKL